MPGSITPAPPRTNRSPKRSSSSAGLNEKPHRPTKRRASKACQCCRSRKVRCNVVEHGPPCTNCRLDEIECIVTESKRKRKSLPKLEETPHRGSLAGTSNKITTTQHRVADGTLDALPNLQGLVNRNNFQRPGPESHVPHSLYRRHSDKTLQGDPLRRPSLPTSTNSGPAASSLWTTTLNPAMSKFKTPIVSGQMLPFYLKPIPPRMGPDEIEYLDKKGALSVPTYGLRDELCRAYIEFVHPLMPLINIHTFLKTIQKGDGSDGTISLLLFQAIMFAGSAFVDLNSLKRAGFDTRKDARKVLFQRVRLLYDFDYETDRLSQVQTLLLMTSCYETSDDKKDAWHWMGIAIATSYTIGLHRNPAISNMDVAQQRVWKRVWWACVIRDRLIALGARRPIRIKSEDCDVPMLTLEDFELEPVPESITCIPRDCKLIRDTKMQTSMAVMCIEKAKFSQCISNVLASQYSLQRAPNTPGPCDMRSATVLSPKAVDPDASTIKICHQELENWRSQLPDDLGLAEDFARDSKVVRGDASLVVHRALLHLIYFATLSALHRPQVLHSSPVQSRTEEENMSDLSRDNLRHAALETTKIAKSLLDQDLVKYLPTTGVTVLQPAIISHLLDIKSSDEQTRRNALQGFCQCIDVMSRLRDCYTAADHSIALVEAAIRRADIKIPAGVPRSSESTLATGEPEPERMAENTEDLVDVGKLEKLVPSVSSAESPSQTSDWEESEDESNEDTAEVQHTGPSVNQPAPPTDYEIARKLELFLASTPLESEPHNVPGVDYLTCVPVGHYTYDNDFDAFIDFSGAGPSTDHRDLMSRGGSQFHSPHPPVSDSALGSTPDWDVVNVVSYHHPDTFTENQTNLSKMDSLNRPSANIPKPGDTNEKGLNSGGKIDSLPNLGSAAGVRVVA